MKKILWLTRSTITFRTGVALALVMTIVSAMITPVPLSGQGLFPELVSLLTSIYDLLNNSIGAVLTQIQQWNELAQKLEQEVLYPVAEIESIWSFVTQMKDTFRGLMGQAWGVVVASATLPSTISLEFAIRNGNGQDFGNLTQRYLEVYRPVPNEADASPLDRQMMDMNDALALDTFKTLNIAEASRDSLLGGADLMESTIEDQLAPGAAAFVTASATIANIHSQVTIQRMLAAQLRQEAGLLAQQNVLRKRKITLANEIRSDVNQLLKQK
jgi:hypothetical protein